MALSCQVAPFLVLWLKTIDFRWGFFSVCVLLFWVARFFSSKSRVYEAKSIDKHKNLAAPLSCHSSVPAVFSQSAFLPLSESPYVFFFLIYTVRVF